MKLISENIHIISKSVKEAVLSRNEEFIKSILTKQIQTNPDWIDLNIGPGKKAFAGTMEWLTNIVKSKTNIPISFDSTNAEEIEKGLELIDNPQDCIINSTNADEDRLETLTMFAAKYNSYLIALTMTKDSGIPKMADERLELAFSILEKTAEKGIENSKIILDPLVLPLIADQTQAGQALDAIRMFNESFEPQVLTTIGLSNVSNGCPRELRPLINRVFFILAAGCGLTTAIVDSFDPELKRINNLLTSKKEEKEYDKFILSLYDLMQNFGELEDLTFDKNNKEEVKIYKTAEILLNKTIYSNSYLI